MSKIPKKLRPRWQELPAQGAPNVFSRFASNPVWISLPGDVRVNWECGRQIVRVVAPAGRKGLSSVVEWLHPIDGWTRCRTAAQNYCLIPLDGVAVAAYRTAMERAEQRMERELNDRRVAEAERGYVANIRDRLSAALDVAPSAVSVEVRRAFDHQVGRVVSDRVEIHLTKRQLRDIIRRIEVTKAIARGDR